MVVALGTMIGWSLLSLTTMLATAFVLVVSAFYYETVGVSDYWVYIAIALLGIFLYYALSAAKELIVSRKTLAQLKLAINRHSTQMMDISMDIVDANRQMNLQDVDRLVQPSIDLDRLVGVLSDLIDIDPTQQRIELSITKTFSRVLKRFGQRIQTVCIVDGDDFWITANPDALESVIFHLLDHHSRYIEDNKANRLTCLLNPIQKTVRIMSDCKHLNPEQVDLLSQLDATTRKDHTSLGLIYTQKMLKSMGARLKINLKGQVAFTISF